jgi:hypothetical protein
LAQLKHIQTQVVVAGDRKPLALLGSATNTSLQFTILRLNVLMIVGGLGPTSPVQILV